MTKNKLYNVFREYYQKERKKIVKRKTGGCLLAISGTKYT